MNVCLECQQSLNIKSYAAKHRHHHPFKASSARLLAVRKSVAGSGSVAIEELLT
ncbi:hypothetical protein K431DRAFT_168886 [Polychaeton citri CBS 116435]|uniref:Uncharacterized protein n=1 Tax=Polychaeton citri CBS 116435 TaxID=1314669 RepID=A0A9P4PXV0_9PEZI|nr:hypothetical protein K431DRAFT_168886 [Polychaeton citri CBS 116435]